MRSKATWDCGIIKEVNEQFLQLKLLQIVFVRSVVSMFMFTRRPGIVLNLCMLKERYKSCQQRLIISGITHQDNGNDAHRQWVRSGGTHSVGNQTVP